jgi:uncharacterized YigZ family protein
MKSPTIPNDYFLTVASPLRAPEFKVKGSRFIADILPVGAKEDVELALGSIRKEFYDASHHCFAYRIGPTGVLLRAADDGEPNGSAGRPILLILTSAKLTDTLLIVTRYFGGTKLGTGGLARAYAEAAQQAVSLAQIQTIYLTDQIHLTLPYDDLAPLERMLTKFQSAAFDVVYLDNVNMKINIRKSLRDIFLAELIESFQGRIGVIEARNQI